MSLWQRVRALFGAKTHAALDRLEDPVETLEYAYQKQLNVLQDVRRGIADVLTSEKRLEIEANQYAHAERRAKDLAAQALRDGDDASARRALERAASGLAQRERLLAESANVRAQRESLEATAADLQRRLETMRTQKLALAARYTAAKAATRAGEAVIGLSNEMDEVARMVERARDKSLKVQARAEAIAELASDSGSDATRAAAAQDSWVEAQLAALKSAAPQAALGDGSAHDV
jgi:phage shock protein A